MDATEIFLDGNNVGELHSHTFIGRKNLKALYLNHSLISSVQNHTFNGLAALQILHLEGNSIKELQVRLYEYIRLVHKINPDNSKLLQVFLLCLLGKVVRSILELQINLVLCKIYLC